MSNQITVRFALTYCAVVCATACAPEAKRQPLDVGPVDDIYAIAADSVIASEYDVVVGRSDEIYVATTDTRYDLSIRTIGPQAKDVREFGRRGQGPGEFMSIGFIRALPGSKVGVFDPALSRYSIFSSEGRFEGSTQVNGLAMRGEYAQLLGQFGDGRFVAKVSRFRQGTDSVPTLVHDTTVLVVHTGTSMKRLAILGVRQYVAIAEGGVSDGLAQRQVAVCDSGFVVVDTAGVWTFNTEGRLLGRGAPPPRLALSAKQKSIVLETAVSFVSDKAIADRATSILKKIIAGVDSTTGGGTIDAMGNIWAYTQTANGRGVYALFDATGKRVRTVRLSPSALLASAGQEIVVGLSPMNQDEERYTRIYSLKDTTRSSRPLGWCGRSSTF